MGFASKNDISNKLCLLKIYKQKMFIQNDNKCIFFIHCSIVKF